MVRMGPYGEVNRTVKENLIKAGALRFDTSISDKQKVLHIEPIQKLFKKFEGKLSTDKIADEIRNKIQFVQGDEYSQQERLNNEKSVLSFYISSHPVMQYNLLFSLFPDINVISPAELQEQEPGTRVAVFGAIESKLQKLTKNNKLYLDLRVGDQVAAENIKIWSPLAELVSSILIQDQLVILAGTVKEDKFMQGAVQLNVSTVTPILTNVGIPVSGIAAANTAICNRVAQVLNAIPGEVTETETAAMMIFKQNAYIKPDHFDMLKSIRGVHYDLAFNSIQDPDIIHGKRYRRYQ
jgi:DNA polymerase III alpha subunit